MTSRAPNHYFVIPPGPEAAEIAKKGRLQGLLDAADLLDAGALKSHKVSFLLGKRKETAAVMNQALLRNMAKLVREMAHDLEMGTGPFAPPVPQEANWAGESVASPINPVKDLVEPL